MRAQVPPSRSSAGLTLLELLLAVTLLAAMTTLIATLWAQAGAWSGENQSHHRTMRLARVLELMRTQWADRRTTVKLDTKGETVSTSPDRVEFVTATPILFPDWPLVKAAYVIERDFDTPAGRPSALKLVYEESRVADLNRPADATRGAGAVPDGISVRAHTLLAGCDELRWERYGDAAPPGGARRAGAPRSPSGDAGAAPDAPPGGDDPNGPGGAGAGGPAPPETPPEWRLFDEPFTGRIPAVRLIGRLEGEDFACVLVVAASR